MAGLFSERSGIVDIGLEGKMLVGAFAAAATAAVTASVWLGLLVAVAVSTALGLLHGFACITCRGNQVVSGVAVNVLAAGLTIVLGIAWFDQGGHTPPLVPTARFAPIELPFAGRLHAVPLLGHLSRELPRGHTPRPEERRVGTE